MEAIFDRLLEIFSLEYMISVIMASYFVIKFADVLNGEKPLPCWVKRVITFAVGGVLMWVFHEYAEISFRTLISSYFAAVFFYDAAIKWLLKKMEIAYKQDE